MKILYNIIIMNRLIKLTVFVLLMLFLPRVFKAIFDFFEVEFELYSPYVLWFYFLLFIIALLPTVKSNFNLN